MISKYLHHKILYIKRLLTSISFKCPGRKTFQPFNLKLYNKKLELRQGDLREHSIPERGGITHRSKSEGKVKLFFNAHHYIKITIYAINMQA